MSRGIVYVVWGEAHIAEAIQSATESASKLPKCLITDRHYPGLEVFDLVKIVDFSSFAVFQNQNMRKYVCFVETPFSETVFIDSDCIILDRIRLGFEAGDLCLCLGLYGVVAHDDQEYIHYNSGVIFFKGTRPDLYGTIIATAQRIQPSGRIADEWPLSLAIHEHQIPVRVLPSIYNCCRVGKVQSKVIRILHTYFDKRPRHLVHDDYGNEFAE